MVVYVVVPPVVYCRVGVEVIGEEAVGGVVVVVVGVRDRGAFS